MKRALIGAILAVFAGIAPVISPAAEKQPSSTVERLHNTLLEVMKEAETLGFEGRYQKLLPVITEEFDLPFVAHYTLGSSWEELSEEQQHQFIETFRELSVVDYARNFDGYSGQHFTIEKETPLPRGRIRVRGKLIDSDGSSSVVFDYLLHQTGNQWRIVNVIADGVSDLAVKRAEYRHIIKAEGFDSLLGKLKEKIALYRHQAEPSSS
ncbi:HpnM family protein [Nitrosococcus watsonii]|uniref:Hopanoid biosynthesis associated membrane protein HpnM n=1 Tax=Nitrosococcus watsoni (strain C-113) TaxID=105559 RepID=D8K5W0_NITWC|nr:HpnM family protein [Nitrosococcus watsonii]ADJ28287.1 hopanoid biosynthesis associated membrane protein HpnM [Nitrosococcus watsonii C-113]